MHGGSRGAAAGGGGGSGMMEKAACIADETEARRQLQHICLVPTHVAFDFQGGVQKKFLMTQLLGDVCTYVFSCVESGTVS